MPTVQTEVHMEIRAWTQCPVCGSIVEAVVGYREDVDNQAGKQLGYAIKLHMATFHGGPAPDVPAV